MKNKQLVGLLLILLCVMPTAHGQNDCSHCNAALAKDKLAKYKTLSETRRFLSTYSKNSKESSDGSGGIGLAIPKFISGFLGVIGINIGGEISKESLQSELNKIDSYFGHIDTNVEIKEATSEAAFNAWTDCMRDCQSKSKITGKFLQSDCSTGHYYLKYISKDGLAGDRDITIMLKNARVSGNPAYPMNIIENTTTITLNGFKPTRSIDILYDRINELKPIDVSVNILPTGEPEPTFPIEPCNTKRIKEIEAVIHASTPTGEKIDFTEKGYVSENGRNAYVIFNAPYEKGGIRYYVHFPTIRIRVDNSWTEMQYSDKNDYTGAITCLNCSVPYNAESIITPDRAKQFYFYELK